MGSLPFLGQVVFVTLELPRYSSCTLECMLHGKRVFSQHNQACRWLQAATWGWRLGGWRMISDRLFKTAAWWHVHAHASDTPKQRCVLAQTNKVLAPPPTPKSALVIVPVTGVLYAWLLGDRTPVANSTPVTLSFFVIPKGCACRSLPNSWFRLLGMAPIPLTPALILYRTLDAREGPGGRALFACPPPVCMNMQACTTGRLVDPC